MKVDPLDSKKYNIDPHRFLFFEKIDKSEDPFLALQTPKDHIDSFKTETQEKTGARTDAQNIVTRTLEAKWKSLPAGTSQHQSNKGWFNGGQKTFRLVGTKQPV